MSEIKQYSPSRQELMDKEEMRKQAEQSIRERAAHLEQLMREGVVTA